jgi:hypothetical protein
MNTIELLEFTIERNRLTINELHSQLVDIVDFIEKNEYINTIEDLQSDNLDYYKSIEILSKE